MKYLILIAILLSPPAFAAQNKKQRETPKECLETTVYDLGFNHGKNGKDLATPDLKNCNPKEREMLVEYYRKGYKEAMSLQSNPKATPVQHAPVQVIVNAEADTGYLASLSKCSDFKKDNSSCFTSYDGEMRSQCEVCREQKSCFIALSGRARSLCEAYIEKKSCFMSLKGTDRGWCEHFKENKSCEKAFGISVEKTSEVGRCERGEIPRDHFFWLN